MKSQVRMSSSLYLHAILLVFNVAMLFPFQILEFIMKMTKSNHQTKLCDPAWSWYHILSCLHEEEELPVRDTGNKVALVVRLRLLG